MTTAPPGLLAVAEQLRRRALRVVVACVVAWVLCYTRADLLFVLMARPLLVAWRAAGMGPPTVHFRSPLEPFFVFLEVALLGALLVVFPYAVYQLWSLSRAARSRRRRILALTAATTLLFYGGAAFAHLVVLPAAFRFFLALARQDPGAMQQLLGGVLKLPQAGDPMQLTPTLMMEEYFSLVWKLLVAFGLVFELPVVLFLLALLGLVNHRQLRRFNRPFVVVAFLVGAVLTPGPDVLTQSLMALPLVLFYNAGILLAYLVERSRRRSALHQDPLRGGAPP